ncbi:MAG TPA: TadE/TadG family type IV pilus assembly protein [Stellaceae bacterium]|nr:TadE/TadG family type IV pilus assembly protein [Stellaceae bacterium]
MARLNAGRLARERRGVTAVEFALLLPFFVILLFGLFQSGQALFIQFALQHAVVGAARCASNFSTANSLGASNTPVDCSTTANTQTEATEQAFGLALASSVFTVCLNQASCPGVGSGSYTGYNCVSAAYPFQFGVPFLPLTTLHLTAASCYPVAG